MTKRGIWRIIAVMRMRVATLIAATMLAMSVATPAAACEVTRSVALPIGSYLPTTVNAAGVPAVQGRAGFSCQAGILALLGSNYIRAQFSSANGLKLKRTDGTETITYKAFADSGATKAFADNAPIVYMQSNTVNLLGLTSKSPVDLPIVVRPDGGVLPPIGTYTDTITIAWNWYICSVAVTNLVCLGSEDKGNVSTEIAVKLIVTPYDVVVSVATTSTWDTANLTNRPKALPGSKGRVSILAQNPNLVALENRAVVPEGGSVVLVYPVPATMAIALDGDGASSGPVFPLSEGATPSTLSFSYIDPGSIADDVDFSSDQGSSWTYAPVAGNRASESAITHVRFRLRGAMAKQSSFAISMPFLVR